MAVNERNRLLRQIGAHCFAAFELQLFLDSHPNNQQALRDRAEHERKCLELKEEYENKYGKLNPSSLMSGNRWTWIDDPWPWNNEWSED